MAPLPFQQHQKIRQQEQRQKSQLSQSSFNSALDILKDKPFWIWDKTEHLRLAKETNQQCCFNHICKCPTKAGREFTTFRLSESLIFDTLMTPSEESSRGMNSFKV